VCDFKHLCATRRKPMPVVSVTAADPRQQRAGRFCPERLPARLRWLSRAPVEEKSISAFPRAHPALIPSAMLPKSLQAIRRLRISEQLHRASGSILRLSQPWRTRICWLAPNQLAPSTSREGIDSQGARPRLTTAPP